MYYHDLAAFEDWDAHVGALEGGLGSLSSAMQNALEIVKTHHDQPRLFREGNYNRHPLRAARILVEEVGVFDETSVLIALCHDLGEWTDYDIAGVNTEFGETVYQGVSALTWDQAGEWSGFVDAIVNSDIKGLVAIKIADKLDNNRASALSGTPEDRAKAKAKTVDVIMPLVQKYCPHMLPAYDEVLARL